MLTVFILLSALAFGFTILSAYRKEPNSPPLWFLWLGVLMLCLIELARSLPLGR